MKVLDDTFAWILFLPLRLLCKSSGKDNYYFGGLACLVGLGFWIFEQILGSLIQPGAISLIFSILMIALGLRCLRWAGNISLRLRTGMISGPSRGVRVGRVGFMVFAVIDLATFPLWSWFLDPFLWFGAGLYWTFETKFADRDTREL